MTRSGRSPDIDDHPRVPRCTLPALIQASSRVDSKGNQRESVYGLLSDEELNTAMHSASVRMDLLHGWTALHPTEGEELARLRSLTDAKRAELERETIGVISSIRAEFRRRDLQKARSTPSS